jgi:small-conductance mechanosensitive channel
MSHFMKSRDVCRLLTLAIVLLPGRAAPVFGQETSTAGTSKDADNDVRMAQVVVDGQTLFSVRGVTAHPSQARANQIEDKIQALAANPETDPNSLTLQEQPGATWIMAGNQRIMAVLDEDAAIEEIARGPLAHLYTTRISNAMKEYRENRRPGFLWLHAAYALGATILLLVFVLIGRRIITLLRTLLERRYRERMESFEGRAHHLVKVEQIWRALTSLLNLLWGIAIAVGVYAYLHYVLSQFPWTREFAGHLYTIAVDPLSTIGAGLVGMIPNVVFLVILAVVIRYALRMVRVIFEGVAAGTITLKGFDPDWAWPTYRLVRLLVIVFAVVVAYPYIPGSESGAFKGVSLFIGIIFSLGSSSLIGNLIAGYSVTYRRAFRVGDRVKIGEHVGDVERIRLLVTNLRTTKNEEVVVPNSAILAAEVVNYSSLAREHGLILHTAVGIRYDVPWRQVEAMLIEAALRSEGMRRDLPPFVLQTGLRDSCVTYEINVYCDTPQKMAPLYTELSKNILDVFNEYGVQIMTPAYEADPQQPQVVPKEQWYAAPAQRAVSAVAAIGDNGAAT